MKNVCKRLNNKSGIVMLMVLMVVIVLMILSVSILSSSLNKNSSSQGQLNDIKCEQLAKGYFWRDHANGAIAPGTFTLPKDADGKVFTITVTGTNPYTYQCQYQ